MTLWWTTGALVLGVMLTGSNAQCQHRYNSPVWRTDFDRPHWRILPSWRDSHFHGLTSVFDDDWFDDGFHRPMFRYLNDEDAHRNKQNAHQLEEQERESQHAQKYQQVNSERPSQAQNRCGPAQNRHDTIRQERQLQQEKQESLRAQEYQQHNTERPTQAHNRCGSAQERHDTTRQERQLRQENQDSLRAHEYQQHNTERPTQAQNRCGSAQERHDTIRQERQLQEEAIRQGEEKVEQLRIEEARRQSQLEQLERAERLLLQERQRRADQYTREQEAFEQKQKEIQRLRQEIGEPKGVDNTEQTSSENTRTGPTPTHRAQEIAEMKQRQQKMAEEQQRIAQNKQYQREAELERQRKHAELERQRMEERERARQQTQREEELRLQERLRSEEARRVEEKARHQRQQEQERLRQDMRREDERKRQAERHHQANQMIIATHQVTGYDPDDIRVSVADNKIKVEGKHICTCTENCVTREFVRGYQLPSNMEPKSVTATLDAQGIINLQGALVRNPTQPTNTIKVKVQGLGIPQSTRPSVDELKKCLGAKGGIKLHKINKGTGKLYKEEKFEYDHDILKPKVNKSSELYKGDNDEFDYDDSSIEVEELDY